MEKGVVAFVMKENGEIQIESKINNLEIKELAETILFIESYVEVLKNIYRNKRIKSNIKS